MKYGLLLLLWVILYCLPVYGQDNSVEVKHFDMYTGTYYTYSDAKLVRHKVKYRDGSYCFLNEKPVFSWYVGLQYRKRIHKNIQLGIGLQQRIHNSPVIINPDVGTDRCIFIDSLRTVAPVGYDSSNFNAVEKVIQYQLILDGTLSIAVFFKRWYLQAGCTIPVWRWYGVTQSVYDAGITKSSIGINWRKPYILPYIKAYFPISVFGTHISPNIGVEYSDLPSSIKLQNFFVHAGLSVSL